VTVVLEADSGFDQLAVALDVHIFVRVHEDIGDRWVFKQRLQRTEAENFIEDLLGKTIPLGHADRKMIFAENTLESRLNFSPEFLPAFRFNCVHIQDVEKLLVDAHFEICTPILVLRRGRSTGSLGSSCSSVWDDFSTH
jgi:hypothetical protein